jgi:hypothetical protein
MNMRAVCVRLIAFVATAPTCAPGRVCLLKIRFLLSPLMLPATVDTLLGDGELSASVHASICRS